MVEFTGEKLRITTLGGQDIYRAGGTDIPPADGGTGVSNNAANTLTFTGNYSLGLTLIGNTSVTLPTSGTLAAIGNGCVLDLNGQEGTGSTISDISGQNNHGTITGATWVKLPSGLWVNSFDGTDDYINCGTNNVFNFTTGDFSLVLWCKFSSFPAYNNYIFSRGIQNASGYELITAVSGAVYFQTCQAATTQSTTSAPLSANTTYLLVMSRSGVDAHIFANGVDITDSAGVHTNPVTNNEALIIFGANNHSLESIGQASLIRIFNRALSAAEIAGIYNEEKHLFAQPTIVSGEIRTASGSLTAGNANAMFFAWHNPELQDIYIKKVVINVGTGGGTVGSLGTVGIADDASYTNGGTEFFTALTLNNVAVYDSWLAGDTGAQTKWVFCQDSASATDGWVVGKITVQNAASLVGNYYIEYTGK